MMSSASDPSSGRYGRRRLPRLTLARRLAAGVPPRLAAEGSGMTPAAVEAMLTERGFQRTVAVYRDLLSAPHEVRLQRLYELARQVLEQALAEGCRLTLFFMLRERSKGRDPVAALVAGIERKLKDAPPPEPPAEPPAATAPPPEPSAEATSSSQPEAATRRRPDPMDAQAWRTATRLRREMIDEAGLATGAAEPAATRAAAQAAAPEEPRDDLDLIDPVADPLGAAVHRLHREADRRHAEQRAATAAATDNPPPQGPNSRKSSLLAAILARKRDGPKKL